MQQNILKNLMAKETTKIYNLIFSIVPADGLALTSTRTSADTVMAKFENGTSNGKFGPFATISRRLAYGNFYTLHPVYPVDCL